MAKKGKIPSWLIYSFVMIFVGILLCVGGASSASDIMGILITVIGVLWIVFGVLDLITADLVSGILFLVLGILLVIFAWTIAWVAFLVLGILMLVYGLLGLVRKTGTVLGNILELVLGILILLIAFGNHLAWDFANVFFYIAGALMIVEGILTLIKH